MTVLRGRALDACAAARFPKWGRLWLYQPPTLARRTMPPRARAVNQMIEDWPFGTMISAARSGPIEEPRLPPVWNIDWASP